LLRPSDPQRMLVAFVAIFAGFWAKDRLLLKRIHGIAAVDPEFGKAVAARNQRRRVAAARVVERLPAMVPGTDEKNGQGRSRSRWR
jgi:hypothetical protein